MILKKLIVSVLIFFLLFPSISFTVSSQQENSNESLFYKFLRLRFSLGWLDALKMGRYFTYQMRPPIPIQAHPEAISINYLNETDFIIGGMKQDKSGWESLVKVGGTWSWAWMNTLVKFSFEFVPPENSSEDVWNVIFDPKELIMKPNKKNLDWPGAFTPFKTNVSIMLKPGVDPRVVTQDVVLKVNIRREEVLDKLGILTMPSFVTDYPEQYKQKCEEIGVGPMLINQYPGPKYYRFFVGPTLTLQNWVLPWYDDWVDSTVEVLIKVNKFHLVDMLPVPTQEIQPYEVKSIPISIKNIGSHTDSYNFNIRCDEEDLIVTPPPALTLKPGEYGEALVGVAAPKSFLSIGETTSIFVDAYSIDDPDKIFTNTIILKTEGIYTTGATTIYSVIFFIFLVIIILLYFYFSRKIRDKDKEEYKETLNMMNDEYNSALLWHKYYIDSVLRKRKSERVKQRKEKAEEKLKLLERKKEVKKEKPVKKVEEKKVEKKEIKVKEPGPEPPAKKEEIKEEKPIEKPIAIDSKTEDVRRKKELVLQKIRKDQEKQKRKFGKTT